MMRIRIKTSKFRENSLDPATKSILLRSPSVDLSKIGRLINQFDIAPASLLSRKGNNTVDTDRLLAYFLKPRFSLLHSRFFDDIFFLFFIFFYYIIFFYYYYYFRFCHFPVFQAQTPRRQPQQQVILATFHRDNNDIERQKTNRGRTIQPREPRQNFSSPPPSPSKER